MQRKNMDDLDSETAAGRDRSEAELEMTEEAGGTAISGTKGGERMGDLNSQTPGLDKDEGRQR
jgi:hypothetical protein